MGFVIIRCAKVKADQLHAVECHNERIWQRHKNPDIDISRSSQNIILVRPKTSIVEEVTKQVDEIHKEQKKLYPKTRALRKDAPRALEYIITASPESMAQMTPEQRQDFFRRSVAFLQQRHGVRRVVSAVVHMDETTPHLHAVVVPETADHKLSARSFMARASLTAMQTAFADQVGKPFGLQRGVEGSKARHKTVLEAKRQVYSELEQVRTQAAQEKEKLTAIAAKPLPALDLQLPERKKSFLRSESDAAYRVRAETELRQKLGNRWQILEARSLSFEEMKKRAEKAEARARDLERSVRIADELRRVTLDKVAKAQETTQKALESAIAERNLLKHQITVLKDIVDFCIERFYGISKKTTDAFKAQWRKLTTEAVGRLQRKKPQSLER